jgi:hypothetical protein
MSQADVDTIRRRIGVDTARQINEDANLGIADGGALYFVMPEAALAARRFDRIMGVVQSH